MLRIIVRDRRAVIPISEPLFSNHQRLRLLCRRARASANRVATEGDTLGRRWLVRRYGRASRTTVRVVAINRR
jgi:hypothetical protein